MKTSTQQDKDFLSDVVGSDMLVKSAEYIENNFAPGDVFDVVALEAWAASADFIHVDRITVDNVSDLDLEAWAEQHGYVKKEEKA